MSRRKKTSPVEAFMDLVAFLPWWGGVALALVFYAVLHRFAQQDMVPAVGPGHIGAVPLASIFQYIVPSLCLAAAGVSAFRRHRREVLVRDVAQSKSTDALDGMSWREFEMLVGEAFRLQGYRVAEIGGGGADGGVDLVLTKGGEKFLVQCKQWKAFRVGVNVVRELYGVMSAQGAAGGYVVTSGRFTDDAVRFAKGLNVKLVDGPELHGLIVRAKASMRGAPSQQQVSQPSVAASPQEIVTGPHCPVCSSTMVRRTARRGVGAGRVFWGCAAFPACRGTRSIE